MKMQALSFLPSALLRTPPRASVGLVHLYRATPRLVAFHHFKRVARRKLLLNPKEVLDVCRSA
jgi:hypothetical protein